MIVPALIAYMGDGYRYYNYETPLVRQENGKVRIYLYSTKEVDGWTRMAEGPTVVVLGACSLKVLEVYDEGPPKKAK